MRGTVTKPPYYHELDLRIRMNTHYSCYRFDHDIAHDISFLPQINEFYFMDLNGDHFQYACTLLQSTIFNAATPMHQFDVIPSKPTNHLTVYQTLAMILHTHSSGADVIAMTCDIVIDASPRSSLSTILKIRIPRLRTNTLCLRYGKSFGIMLHLMSVLRAGIFVYHQDPIPQSGRSILEGVYC